MAQLSDGECCTFPDMENPRVEGDKMEPIAVIGFAARLPGDATSAKAFWQMLSEGRSARTKIPHDRFNIDAFYHPDNERIDTTNVRTGNFVTGDIAAFDAPFFSIQPAEVASMDPQQRIMLETSYWALENSGLPMESMVGSKTCVYVGSSSRDYEALLLRDPESPAKYIGTGIGTSMLANRVSWFYDLQGPSVALDTACSSSLTAFHLACQSLRSHDATTGLVGGCSLILAPDVSMVHLSNMGFFSPDGRCYTFDDRANGYAKGEGAGFVVIKLLADALADGNTIRAVVRATGLNQDGKTPGLTQPSSTAQEQNIRYIYASGGLDLGMTKYFEAHGTGTQIGDSIEVQAIGAAFQKGKDDPLYVGAVKPNIGHLEAGSGIASLIKTIMVLEKGLIPPNINFKRPNVALDTERWHIRFPLETVPWPTDGLRRASINSFGYGGSNAHCVLDDAFNYLALRHIEGIHCTAKLPPKETRSSNRMVELAIERQSPNEIIPVLSTEQPKVFVWSASDEDGLRRLAYVYQAHIGKLSTSSDADSNHFMDNLSYTLSNKRSMLPWKAFVIASSTQEIGQNLPIKMSKPVRSSRAPALSFVFTGQGAQWAGMGRELLVYPAFETSLRQSESYLQSLGSGWTLIDKLQTQNKTCSIDTPVVAQPSCTALQIALVDLLASWGIVATAVAGHSSGEIAAAYCAGSLSHESALRIAYYRGELATRLADRKSSPRAMISVALSEEAVAPYLEEVMNLPGAGKITVGCVNSPANVTVTGDRRCIDDLNTLMDQNRIFARKLPVDVAYHSSYMEEIAAEYSSLIKDISPRSGLSLSKGRCCTPAVFSSVVGARVSPESLSQSKYWVANLVSKVRFSDALSDMSSYLVDHRPNQKTGKNLLIEIGPTAALQRPIKDSIDKIKEARDIEYDSVLKRNVSGLESCLAFIGRLHCGGYKTNLAPINSPTMKESDLRLLVDLPQYPFNNSQSYWTESRMSKRFRMRKHARHELLGAPSADWNPSEPKWRNFIRSKENPWIVDHKLGGSELYPASGMMAMVIEAARQLASPERTTRGYKLQDVVFQRALLLSPAPEGVETQLRFRRREPASTKSSESQDFTLYAYLNEEWSSICEGTVIVGYADTAPENGRSVDGVSSLLEKSFEAGVQNCKQTISSKRFYKNLANYGFHFGPTFQPLEHIRYNENGEAVASIRLDGWTEKMASGSTQKQVIHPTALDGIFQLGMAAISKGSWAAIPTMVPTQLKSLWISHDLLERTPANGEIEVYTKLTFRGYREADFSIVARDAASKKIQILTEGWRETALSSVNVPSDEPGLRCYHVIWKPDPAFLDGSQVRKLCEEGVDSTSIPIDNIAHQCELICAYFMSLIVNKTFQATTGLQLHLQRYLEWTRHHFEFFELETFLASDPDGHRMIHDDTYCEKFMNDCARSSQEGELCVRVGKKLPNILRGELDPLDLLSTAQVAQSIYSSPALAITYGRITTYIDLLAHKDPSLKILEIGAGTGAATEHILRSLDSGKDLSNVPRFDEYMYTDISPSFFEGAKDRFQDHSNRMKYAVLDIEKDPLEQGFELHKYDMIVCCLVLHATAHIHTALQNTRKLLKPGGKLVLVESSNLDCARASFVSGLLPGWWLSTEEKRAWGPLLSDVDWHDTLLENGFSGAEICLPDSIDKRRHTFSAIISTALGTVQPDVIGQKTNIIISPSSAIQKQLGSLISKKQPSCQVMTIQDIHVGALENSFCICLLETDSPFLANMSGQDFEALKLLVASAAGILWVTQGCGERAQRPELGLVTGFGRNMQSETWGNKFVELAVEGESSFNQTVDHIVEIYHESLLLDCSESEYRQTDGRLCISRVVEAQSVNTEIDAKAPDQAPKQREYGSLPNEALELHIGSPGLLDSFHYEDDERFDMPVGADEVEVKVQATGMNFKDTLIALGQLPGNSLGYECAGFVARVGKDATFSPGDRVLCCTTTGAYKTYARAHATSVARISENVPFPAAAALPTVFCTAYHSLFNVARLQAGESVLIHSGAGGVGQAAIQLAKLLKADIFTTVGTDEKKVFLMGTYGIPEGHIFSSRNSSFAEPLSRLTGGVDVVLNSLSGDGLRASWSCIRPFGRFVELGKSDIQSSRGGLPMAPFAQNVTFASVDLGLLMDQAKPIMAAILAAVMALYDAAKIIVPQPLHVFSVSELEKAFRFLQSGKNMGKVVVEMQEDAIVSVVPSPKPTYSFDANATYVIAGGLGGLGRSITRWMADRNAKNFILLSRSGAKSKDATDLVSDMHQRGVRIVAPPCDISTEGAVLNVLRDHKHTMPPVKGCIQASMVLKDGLFENMSREDFNAAIMPKVQGSWNLHNYLPQHLDFFVLLSSVASVTGSRGQSNYAAGNSYQDALARHRVSLGEKCISLNLGPVQSIGFAAEVDMTEALEADGFVSIRKPELFALLDYCCNPSLPLCTAQNCQIVTGLGGIESSKADKPERAYWAKRPLFSILKQKGEVETSTNGNAGDDTVDYASLLAGAESQPAAEDIVVEALKAKLSTSLSIPKEDVDAEKAIYAFGIDSLVALEVRYWFMKEMKANVAIFDIMRNQSLLALGQYAAGKSEYRQKKLDGGSNG